MSIPDQLLPDSLLFGTFALWIPLLLIAASRTPWIKFREASRIHVFCAATLLLSLLWHLEASALPGLGFHFLGTTVFTLMFGWPLAVLGTTLAALIPALTPQGSLMTLAYNALLLGALPVSISYGLYRTITRYLPKHLFIYIFLCGFANAIVTAALVVFTLAGLLALTEVYSIKRISLEYIPFLPLYLLPEGVLNGMLITVLIALKPHWLETFDDQDYLK